MPRPKRKRGSPTKTSTASNNSNASSEEVSNNYISNIGESSSPVLRRSTRKKIKLNSENEDNTHSPKVEPKKANYFISELPKHQSHSADRDAETHSYISHTDDKISKTLPKEVLDGSFCSNEELKLAISYETVENLQNEHEDVNYSSTYLSNENQGSLKDQKFESHNKLCIKSVSNFPEVSKDTENLDGIQDETLEIDFKEENSIEFIEAVSNFSKETESSEAEDQKFLQEGTFGIDVQDENDLELIDKAEKPESIEIENFDQKVIDVMQDKTSSIEVKDESDGEPIDKSSIDCLSSFPEKNKCVKTKNSEQKVINVNKEDALFMDLKDTIESSTRSIEYGSYFSNEDECSETVNSQQNLISDIVLINKKGIQSTDKPCIESTFSFPETKNLDNEPIDVNQGEMHNKDGSNEIPHDICSKKGEKIAESCADPFSEAAFESQEEFTHPETKEANDTLVNDQFVDESNISKNSDTGHIDLYLSASPAISDLEKANHLNEGTLMEADNNDNESSDPQNKGETVLSNFELENHVINSDLSNKEIYESSINQSSRNDLFNNDEAQDGNSKDVDFQSTPSQELVMEAPDSISNYSKEQKLNTIDNDKFLDNNSEMAVDFSTSQNISTSEPQLEVSVSNIEKEPIDHHISSDESHSTTFPTAYEDPSPMSAISNLPDTATKFNAKYATKHYTPKHMTLLHSGTPGSEFISLLKGYGESSSISCYLCCKTLTGSNIRRHLLSKCHLLEILKVVKTSLYFKYKNDPISAKDLLKVLLEIESSSREHILQFLQPTSIKNSCDSILGLKYSSMRSFISNSLKENTSGICKNSEENANNTESNKDFPWLEPDLQNDSQEGIFDKIGLITTFRLKFCQQFVKSDVIEVFSLKSRTKGEILSLIENESEGLSYKRLWIYIIEPYCMFSSSSHSSSTFFKADLGKLELLQLPSDEQQVAAKEDITRFSKEINDNLDFGSAFIFAPPFDFLVIEDQEMFANFRPVDETILPIFIHVAKDIKDEFLSVYSSISQGICSINSSKANKIACFLEKIDFSFSLSHLNDANSSFSAVFYHFRDMLQFYITQSSQSDDAITKKPCLAFSKVIFIGTSTLIKMIPTLNLDKSILAKSTTLVLEFPLDLSHLVERINKLALDSKNILVISLFESFCGSAATFSSCTNEDCQNPLSVIENNSKESSVSHIKTLKEFVSKISEKNIGKVIFLPFYPLSVICQNNATDILHPVLHAVCPSHFNLIDGSQNEWNETISNFSTAWNELVKNSLADVRIRFDELTTCFSEKIPLFEWKDPNLLAMKTASLSEQSWKDSFVKFFAQTIAPLISLENVNEHSSLTSSQIDLNLTSEITKISIDISMPALSIFYDIKNDQVIDYSSSSIRKNNESSKSTIYYMLKSLRKLKISKSEREELGFHRVFIIGNEQTIMPNKFPSQLNVTKISISLQGSFEHLSNYIIEKLSQCSYNENDLCLLIFDASVIGTLRSSSLISCSLNNCNKPINLHFLKGKDDIHLDWSEFVYRKIDGVANLVKKLSNYLPTLVLPLIPTVAAFGTEDFILNSRVAHAGLENKRTSFFGYGSSSHWKLTLCILQKTWPLLVLDSFKKFPSMLPTVNSYLEANLNIYIEASISEDFFIYCFQSKGWKDFFHFFLETFVQADQTQQIELMIPTHNNNDGPVFPNPQVRQQIPSLMGNFYPNPYFMQPFGVLQYPSQYGQFPQRITAPGAPFHQRPFPPQPSTTLPLPQRLSPGPPQQGQSPVPSSQWPSQPRAPFQQRPFTPQPSTALPLPQRLSPVPSSQWASQPGASFQQIPPPTQPSTTLPLSQRLSPVPPQQGPPPVPSSQGPSLLEDSTTECPIQAMTPLSQIQIPILPPQAACFPAHSQSIAGIGQSTNKEFILQLRGVSKHIPTVLFQNLASSYESGVTLKEFSSAIHLHIKLLPAASALWKKLDNLRIADCIIKVKNITPNSSLAKPDEDDGLINFFYMKVYLEQKHKILMNLQKSINAAIDIASYKTERCHGHEDQLRCSFYHNEYDKRRNPIACSFYSASPCVSMKLKVNCPLDLKCLNSHTSPEQMFHPSVFQIRLCSKDASCPKRPFCQNAHIDTPETMYTSYWKDCIVFGLMNSFEYLAGAIRGRYKAPNFTGGRVIFISPDPEVLSLAEAVSSPIVRHHRGKLLLLTHKMELSHFNCFDVILGSVEDLLRHGTKIFSSARKDAALIIDDIVTILNNQDQRTGLSNILNMRQTDSVNKIFVANNDDSDVSRTIQRSFGLYLVTIRKARSPEPIAKTASQSSPQPMEVESLEDDTNPIILPNPDISSDKIKIKMNIPQILNSYASQNKVKADSIPANVPPPPVSLPSNSSIFVPVFKKSKSPRRRSRSPKRKRSRTPSRRRRSRTPRKRHSRLSRSRSRSPKRKSRSRSPKRKSRAHSPKRKSRSRSPKRRKRRRRSNSSSSSDRRSSPVQSSKKYSPSPPPSHHRSKTSLETFKSAHPLLKTRQDMYHPHIAEQNVYQPPSKADSHAYPVETEKERQIRNEIDEEYTVYEEVPELHADFEKHYETFARKYQLDFAGVENSNHKEQAWLQFWKVVVNHLKSTALRAKLAELHREMSKIVSHSSVSGTSSQMQQSTNPDTFTIKGTLELLVQLKDKMGMIGSALMVLVEDCQNKGVTTPEALKVFADPEAEMITKMVLNKLKSSMDSSSAILKPIIATTCEWTEKMLQFAKNSPQEEQQAKPRICVESIAKGTVGKDSTQILNFIKMAFHYEGITNPSKEEVNKIFLDVCSVHFKMSS